MPEAEPTEASDGFEDEHCTKFASGTGVKYVHEPITAGTKTQLKVSSTETVKFKTIIAGASIPIEAKSFTSCANKTSVENKENGSKQMEAAGEFCGEFKELTVSGEKFKTCKINGGTVVLNEKNLGKTVVKEPKASQFEMYVELTPPESKAFTTLTVEGAECILKGIKVEVTGSLKGTVTTEEGCSLVEGPTLKFTTAGTEGTLKAGTQKAQLEGTFTARMATEKEKEPPVVLTTTNS